MTGCSHRLVRWPWRVLGLAGRQRSFLLKHTGMVNADNDWVGSSEVPGHEAGNLLSRPGVREKMARFAGPHTKGRRGLYVLVLGIAIVGAVTSALVLHNGGGGATRLQLWVDPLGTLNPGFPRSFFRHRN